MISNIDIEDMTDAQDEAPMRVYLKPGLIRQAGGYPATLTFPDHPKAIEYVRSDLARPSQAGDERVARLVKAAKRVAWVFPCLNQTETDAMVALDAALAAMDTPKGGGDE